MTEKNEQPSSFQKSNLKFKTAQDEKKKMRMEKKKNGQIKKLSNFVFRQILKFEKSINLEIYPLVLVSFRNIVYKEPVIAVIKLPPLPNYWNNLRIT